MVSSRIPVVCFTSNQTDRFAPSGSQTLAISQKFHRSTALAILNSSKHINCTTCTLIAARNGLRAAPSGLAPPHESKARAHFTLVAARNVGVVA